MRIRPSTLYWALFLAAAILLFSIQNQVINRTKEDLRPQATADAGAAAPAIHGIEQLDRIQKIAKTGNPINTSGFSWREYERYFSCGLSHMEINERIVIIDNYTNGRFGFSIDQVNALGAAISQYQNKIAKLVVDSSTIVGQGDSWYVEMKPIKAATAPMDAFLRSEMTPIVGADKVDIVMSEMIPALLPWLGDLKAEKIRVLVSQSNSEDTVVIREYYNTRLKCYIQTTKNSNHIDYDLDIAVFRALTGQ